MEPGMSGHPGASAPAPVVVASVTALVPAGPLSLEATPVRVLRSKPSSATLLCALVGEREGVAGGWEMDPAGHLPVQEASLIYLRFTS